MAGIGIKESKELIDGTLTIGNVVYKQLQDGFQFTDAMAILPALIVLPNALQGIDQIPAEIGDLDDAEREELVALVAKKLQIDGAKAAKIAQKSLRAGLALGELITAIAASE